MVRKFFSRSKYSKPFPKKFSWRSLLIKKNLKRVALFGGISFVLLLVLLFVWIAKDLPSAKKLESRLLAESTKIYAHDGTLLYEVYKERKRTVIPTTEIPDYLKKATIALEDKNFYHHFGIDLKGMARAFFHNLFYRDRIQGGSTLTQQFVKNALLSPERTFSRKLKEITLSLVIEKMYNKDEILAMYLNEIPYGSSNYGAEAAAQTFFGKSAKNLNLVESVALASLPTAPSYYSPYGTHKKDLLERMDYVLDQMVKIGSISPEEAEKAKKDKKKLKFNEIREDIKAPHFVMYVRDLLIDKYGERMVDEGGLKVYTSLDLKKQRIAEEAVRNGVERLKWQKASNASLVSIDPKSGEILAMVGSVDYWDKKNDGNVNVAVMPRQPGSSFKPFAYATAFMKGYSPATMLVDVVTDFGGGWRPKNYDGTTRGLTDGRHGLAQSLNISSVKMLYLAGIDDTIENAHKMGITTLQEKNRYGLALILGGGEVKLLDMTYGYSVFANLGLKHTLKPILKIEKSNGEILEENKTDAGKEALPPQIAYQITNILSDNAARAPVFGYYSALNLDRPAAAKTGTSEDWNDSWTLGYTPNLAAGVWVGNNDNSPMGQVAGAIGAAPIWNEYMRKALSGMPWENFKVPSGIKKIAVCRISGQLPTGACKEGLKTEVFAEDYNVPKERCNVHLASVKVCKISNKLANPNCPLELVQFKNYKQILPEIPKTDPAYPRWAGPVFAYARSRGYNQFPPTQVCDLHTGGDQPQIEGFLVNPEVVNVGNPISISGNITAPHGIKNISIYFDNNLIAQTTTIPFDISYIIPEGTSLGNHQIKVKVQDNVYYAQEEVKTIEVTAEGGFSPPETKVGSNGLPPYDLPPNGKPKKR